MQHAIRSSASFPRRRTIPLSSVSLLAMILASTTSRAAEPTPDAVRLNRTIELLAAKQATFGLFSRIHTPGNVQALAQSDLDFVVIDMEHQPFDAERLRVMLLGMTDKQALDVGAFGIMFPYVETPEEALAAIRAMRYPQKKGASDAEPVGLRGFAPVNAVWYWGLSLAEYTDRADVWPLDPRGELLAAIQIETPRGVANIERILDVPGIGAIFIGPADMSQALGVADNPDAPELEEAIQKVLAACRRRSMPCGIIAYTPVLATRRVQEGFTFLIIGVDGGMTPAADASLKASRSAAGRK